MLTGSIFLILAEFMFAISTIWAKQITNTSTIPAIEIIFFRFLFGFLISAFYLIKDKKNIIPKNWNLVIWRGILNTIAVLLFFAAVQYTSITNANMLNMTYPLFIFIIAPFIAKEKLQLQLFPLLGIALIGIYLVINPAFAGVNLGDYLGLGSGIIAAFGVITLRLARKQDSTTLIIFYLMTTGLILSSIIVYPFWQTPHGLNTVYVILSALAGVLGQIFITHGYKYVQASTGSIMSASRIIFASVMGFYFFQEQLSLLKISGILLVITALITVSFLYRHE